MANLYDPIEATIEIAAPQDQVWRVVSDLRAMPRWSPQVAKTLIRGPIREGAKMVNINKEGLKIWPTTAKVTRFEPRRDVAFRVKENWAEWSFTLEPTADGSGTKVTHRRETPKGTTKVSQKLVDRFFGGAEKFRNHLESGMNQTLQRMKQSIER